MFIVSYRKIVSNKISLGFNKLQVVGIYWKDINSTLDNKRNYVLLN